MEATQLMRTDCCRLEQLEGPYIASRTPAARRVSIPNHVDWMGLERCPSKCASNARHDAKQQRRQRACLGGEVTAEESIDDDHQLFS